MIFGKPPWACKSIADLQNKVRTQSGSRLPIPSNPPTSNECKELLRALITPDPNRRIEWDDFFNHKLFDNYQDNNQPAPADMRQSVMFRNHEDRVNQLFKNNKKTIDRRVVDLIEDPRKIKLDLQQAHRNDSNRDTERIIEAAIFDIS